MAAMEPIVVALEIDEFRIGASKVATTWPTGTMLQITEIDGALRPDGRRMIRAYPLGLTAREGVRPVLAYTLNSDGNGKPLGRFIHAPNTDSRIRGNENVIYFTPPVPSGTGPDNNRYVILADPCTVGGPGDEIYDSPYNINISGKYEPGMLVCGPKFVSAAVGGVCALDWRTQQHKDELVNDASLTTAYAGAPAFFQLNAVRT